MDDRFIQQLVGDLQRGYAAAAALEDGALRAIVADEIVRARRYGIVWASSLADFVALRFELGGEHDQPPWIHEVLSDSSVSPELRLQRVRKRLAYTAR